tara:strand:- start:272 stop:442 length:171 start_codon:yes stop_codon:yes gene_type:complete
MSNIKMNKELNEKLNQEESVDLERLDETFGDDTQPVSFEEFRKEILKYTLEIEPRS